MIKWWQFRKRSRCPHIHLDGIYGDETMAAGWFRLWCRDCGKFLDGPVIIQSYRQHEANRYDAGRTSSDSASS